MSRPLHSELTGVAAARHMRGSALAIFVLTLSVLLLSPSRAPAAYTDLNNYASHFSMIGEYGASFVTRPDAYEPGYELLTLALARAGLSFDAFVAVLFAVFCANYFKCVGELSSSALTALLALGLFAVSPLAESFHYIFLRQGLAIAILLMALRPAAEGRVAPIVVLGLAAAAFHVSSAIFFAALALATISFNGADRVWSAAYVLCTIFYVANLFAGAGTAILQVSEALATGYEGYGRTSGYATGFKPAFAALTLVGVVAAAGLPRSGRLPPTIYRYFLIASCAYMICSSIPYYDRLAVYSWVLVPFLVAQAINALLGTAVRRRAPALPGHRAAAR
jgi:hypothetical protein